MAGGTRATIPIFPLANVVLFPKLRVPLYIFEPRYRQMTREALDGARRIGMVTVRPDHIEDTAGDPPIFSIGCEGRIVQSELLADGGYNVVLLGARRFEILSEQLPDGDRLYRTAEVALLSEASTRESPPTDLAGLPLPMSATISSMSFCKRATTSGCLSARLVSSPISCSRL